MLYGSFACKVEMSCSSPCVLLIGLGCNEVPYSNKLRAFEYQKKRVIENDTLLKLIYVNYQIIFIVIFTINFNYSDDSSIDSSLTDSVPSEPSILSGVSMSSKLIMSPETASIRISSSSLSSSIVFSISIVQIGFS